MKRLTIGKAAGRTGLGLFLGSWGAFYPGGVIFPEAWGPWVYLLATIAIAVAAVAGFVAARMHSKWWYCLVALACLSLAVLLTAVAV